MKQIITEIQTRFNHALSTKTSWGRNEINTIYSQIVIDVLAENVPTEYNPVYDSMLGQYVKPPVIHANLAQVDATLAGKVYKLEFDPNQSF